MGVIKNILESLNISTLAVSQIRVTDIIDIFIVAYLVYKVMVWIRETRAWSLFKGIAVIFAVSTLASYMQLNTITWIINNTLAVGITAVIVIFQPELRKALEQLGNRKIFPTLFASVEEDAQSSLNGIEEIIIAAFKMSKVKTGALIVIEQEVALGDLEQTGIPIDAIVSSQLLINIFENKTPLHDGAVVIRKSRIAAATCILPLTQSEIGLDLGTRHRAAVGCSEVSDAYVLVVSEETGAVSIARSGKLHKNLSEEKARKILLKSGKGSPNKKKIFAKGRLKNGKNS